MTLRLKETKYINTLSVHVAERYLSPTDNQITELKKDIEEKGQRVPILVHRILRNTYRLVAGATRLQAMVQLGEKKIYATICHADSDTEYQIAELDENVMRRDLTAEQRSEMKAKMRELQKQAMANVEPAKGGRGKKGGISEAARAAGIPRQTAQRRKGAQNTSSGQVCANAKSVGAKQAAKTRAMSKTCDAYGAKFGTPQTMQLDDNIIRLMEASLKSGVDAPELIELKRKQQEYLQEYDRKEAEFLATPITADTECDYTARIKNHKLYEGDCGLAWARYFEYRDEHPECTPLTSDDIAYVSQWTDAAHASPSDNMTESESEESESEESVSEESESEYLDHPNGDDREYSTVIAASLENVMRRMTCVTKDEPEWPDVIEYIGLPKLRKIIAVLQAVHDAHLKDTANDDQLADQAHDIKLRLH
jgi:ParB/RepB/Spo0J family partition protein